MEPCNHAIGFGTNECSTDVDYVYEDKAGEEAKRLKGYIRHWLSQDGGQKSVVDSLKTLIKEGSVKDILEKEGVATFKYCPLCGGEINWDKINGGKRE